MNFKNFTFYLINFLFILSNDSLSICFEYYYLSHDTPSNYNNSQSLNAETFPNQNTPQIFNVEIESKNKYDLDFENNHFFNTLILILDKNIYPFNLPELFEIELLTAVYWHELAYCHDIQNISQYSYKPVTDLAIIGAGGAGCITALLLSNIIKEKYLNKYFHVTLIEDAEDILPYTCSFAAAAVLHAEGNEYPSSTQTQQYCQETGKVFKAIFPSLYSLNIEPITFKYTNHENHVESIKSYNDQRMKNIERNYLIRSSIKQRRRSVTVKTGHKVYSIFKNENHKYKIKAKVGTNESCEEYSHVIISAWSKCIDILKNSQLSQKIKTNYCIEERFMAIADITNVPHSAKIPFFQIPNGGMFMPITEQKAWVYHCSQGASYPISETTHNKHEHGRIIIDRFKKMLGYTDSFSLGIQHMKHYGTIQQKIVRERSSQLHERIQPETEEIDDDLYILLPLKATYIPYLSLNLIKKIFTKFMQEDLVIQYLFKDIINDIDNVLKGNITKKTSYLTIQPDNDSKITSEILEQEEALFMSHFCLENS